MGTGAPPLPEYIRLPRVGERCSITGMSRAILNRLILGENPPVRSVSILRPGTSRGVRLVETKSLLQYLQRHLMGRSVPEAEADDSIPQVEASDGRTSNGGRS
jgi:hypothetical protein